MLNHTDTNSNNIGVLLTNLGTPDSPSILSVVKYLHEFLTDRRVIQIPSYIWLPLLYGVILPLRSIKAAQLYQKIWTLEGSPLRINFHYQILKLENYFKNKNIKIYAAMRYGNPSLQQALEEIKKNNIKKLLLFPLYPQYSSATTASTFDKVADILKFFQYQPELRVINHYYDYPSYISVIADTMKENIKKYNPQKIVFSFHGLPQSIIDKGDPYETHCKITAKLLAEKLNLTDEQWVISFQSRLGKTQWLKPYTIEMMKTLANQKIKNISVICPGFSSDCLETLEEINIQNRKIYMEAGGEVFNYIPCLNNSEPHIKALAEIIQKHIQGWN